LRLNRKISPLWFCLPAVLTLATVAGFPLIRTTYFAFTDARLGRLEGAQIIGFENFKNLLLDPDWWRSIWNTCSFTLISVSLETFIGLAIALMLNLSFQGRGVLRAAVLIPWAIPAVVSARIWAWMFNDLYGVINESLLKLHLIDSPIAWLAEDRFSLGILVLVDVWKTSPFMALLLLAGLQSIPKSVYEAAKLEGISPWKEFIHITLPLLKPALLVALIFRTMDALRIFDLPFVLTNNSRANAVVSIYARQQLVDFQDVGYGSAASFLIFCLIGIFAIAYLLMGRKSLELDR